MATVKFDRHDRKMVRGFGRAGSSIELEVTVGDRAKTDR